MEVVMAMKKPQKARCPKAKIDDVLCCTGCGLSAVVDHDHCDEEGMKSMKNPTTSKCVICEEENVLCCQACGKCGVCSTHDGCSVNQKLTWGGRISR